MGDDQLLIVSAVFGRLGGIARPDDGGVPRFAMSVIAARLTARAEPMLADASVW
jgi:hypothetical protein